MSNIVIANIIALIASLLMVYTGIIKRKDRIIFIQTIQIGLSVLSNIILGGITGAIINAISCIRNILCYKEKLGKLAKALIIIASIVPSLMFNNLGFIGILPIISAVTYTLFMDTKDIIKFKYLTIFIMFLWGTYDLYIKSYSSAAFDFMTIIANIIAVIKLKIANKHEVAE